MVGHQRPGANGPTAGPTQFRQQVDEVLPVFLVSKYLAGLVPPAHDVMQGLGSIQPRLPGHVSLDSAFRSSCQVYSETTYYFRKKCVSGKT